MREPVRLEFRRNHLTPSARGVLAGTFLLISIGLVSLLSASSYRALLRHDDLFYYLKLQGQGVFVGSVALLVAAHIRPERWLRFAVPIGGVTLILLVLVFPPFGERVNGASRWLRWGGLGFQPSELAKLAVPLLIAWAVQRFPALHGAMWKRGRRAERAGTADEGGAFEHRRSRRTVWFRLCQLAGLALFVGLIAMEPDYGTAAFIFLVGTVLLLVTRLQLVYVGLGAVAALPAVAILILQRDFGELSQRFNGFLDPESVTQVWQSLLAIGSGSWTGAGLGAGVCKNLYLPEAHNDFIFAVFAEETGFLGVTVLIALLSVLLQSGWRVVSDCPHPALRILGLGVVLNITLQAIANIAVATASAPTKGIGLPFVSYGSSGLTVAMLEVGILLAISKLRVREVTP